MNKRPVAFIAFISAVMAAFPTLAEPIKFLVIGDLPYNAEQQRVLETKIRPAIGAGSFPFAIHLGDFKGGGLACTEEGLRTAHGQIMSLIPERVFYTPGDNDWTDCDRDKLSKPISELKRLADLRRVFFADPMLLPRQWHFARQPELPENAVWRHDHIQFATLHVVGTNNGRVEIELDDKSTALDDVDARDAANRTWLRKAFTAARKPSIQALVVAMQADITKVKWSRPCNAKRRSKCDAFAGLRGALAAESSALGKPVLVIHGDTGRFCIDREFGGEQAPNLWRLNSAGDYVVDAAVVEFDAMDKKRHFKIHRLLTKEPLTSGC